MTAPLRMQHPANDDDALDLIDAEDPYVVAQITRALAPYQGKLAPEALEAMRENLVMALTTHPVGARLADAARRTPHVQRSGTREKE